MNYATLTNINDDTLVQGWEYDASFIDYKIRKPYTDSLGVLVEESFTMNFGTVNNVYSLASGPLLKIDQVYIANEATDSLLPKVNFNTVSVTDSLSENG